MSQIKPLPYLCREGYCLHPEHTNPNRKYVEQDGIVFIEEQNENYDPVVSLLEKMTLNLVEPERCWCNNDLTSRGKCEVCHQWPLDCRCDLVERNEPTATP